MTLYPSLMIGFGYVSRAVPDPKTFSDVRAERFAAKDRGDKKTANALKSPLNKAFGAMLNRYNPMHDARNGRSVCISGQLAITQLMVAYSRIEGLEILQSNTDGVIVDIPDEAYGQVVEANRAWQEATGLRLEEERIRLLVQKDVNNYVMVREDGSRKVKGAWLVRGISPVGAWSINNTATVVARAIADFLADGVPVEETVRACDDPAEFQIIAKAGSMYPRVYQLVGGEEVDVQRCNRVFASGDGSLGRLYKVKADGSTAKVEALPEHCLISNAGMPAIEDIDKGWYERLAAARAAEFLPAAKGESMAEAKSAANEPDFSQMNVYAKLAVARRMFLDAHVEKTGKNVHLQRKYFELDDITPTQTRVFDKVGLVEVFGFSEFKDADGGVSGTVLSTVVNVDKPDEFITFSVPLPEIYRVVNRDGEDVTNPIQAAGMRITYMRRYMKLVVLDVSEPDDVEFDAKPDPKPEPKAAPRPSRASKPAEAQGRKEVADGIAAKDAPAGDMQLRQLKKSVKRLHEYVGEHPEAQAWIADVSLKTEKLTKVTKAECERYITEIGDMVASYEGGE